MSKNQCLNRTRYAVAVGTAVVAIAAGCVTEPGPDAGTPEEPTTTVGDTSSTVPETTTTAPEPSETVVVEENFDGLAGLPAGWQAHAGAWSVQDGVLKGVASQSERSRLTFGTSAPNFRFEARANFDAVANATRWLNLGADMHGAADWGSVFVVRSDASVSNGIEYAIKDSPTGAFTSPKVGSSTIKLNTKEWHDLTLEVHGDHAMLSIDGVQQFWYDDVTRVGGQYGLVINGATVLFDDVRITELSDDTPTPTTTTVPEIVGGFAKTLFSGPWQNGHVQGIAVDTQKGFVYYSFTNLLVKTDLAGNIVGTIGGFTGHLGDLEYNPATGKVYGSLEYKAQEAFYIAVIDVDQISTPGLTAQGSEVFKTVYLPEVVADYTADMNADGVFDGNVGTTADHRFGCSGIDGVSFGPAFGQTGGTQFLTVAYGVYANNGRTDNDNQVLLQYDIADWEDHARPLLESAPHQSGPAAVDGKYFVHTGNTSYGVQNLEYDAERGRWFMGVYTGSKPQFPNYSMFAVDAASAPVFGAVPGTGVDGFNLPLANDGLTHAETGIRGWFQKSDVGIEALGDGRYYLAVNGSSGGQTATLRLARWTGDASAPFSYDV